MKKLELEISDEVFDELYSVLVGKRITNCFHGVHDEFLLNVVEAMEEGKPTLRLKCKEESSKEE